MWARLSLRGEGWGEGELDSRHFHELRSCEPNSPLPYRLPNLPVVGLFGSSACRVRSRPARLPSANRKPGLYYEARRRLEWPKVIPRESPMIARRLSHDSPVCLARSDNRFGLCNWGPSDVSQKKTLYHLQIQRAAHPQSRSGHYVRVNRRRAHVHMAEQILERADLRAGKQGTNFERPTLNIERRTGLLASLPLSWPTRRLATPRGSPAAGCPPAATGRRRGCPRGCSAAAPPAG